MAYPLYSDDELRRYINKEISALQEEGFTVTFGTIGDRTTWCLLKNKSVEVVGYTYIRGDLANKRDLYGQYKALIQALSRKRALYDLDNGGVL